MGILNQILCRGFAVSCSNLREVDAPFWSPGMALLTAIASGFIFELRRGLMPSTNRNGLGRDKNCLSADHRGGDRGMAWDANVCTLGPPPV
jgi:hypothetical protein